jgi:hypothetical protein
VTERSNEADEGGATLGEQKLVEFKIAFIPNRILAAFPLAFLDIIKISMESGIELCAKIGLAIEMTISG